MEAFIKYACGLVDCSIIRPGGACFDPPLIASNANYLLNYFYKYRHDCNQEIGTIRTIDPCNHSLSLSLSIICGI